MLKLLVFACLLAVSLAAPKPDLVYTSPLAALTPAYSAAAYPAASYPAAAYTAAAYSAAAYTGAMYSAPLAYTTPYTAASSSYYFRGPYSFLLR